MAFSVSALKIILQPSKQSFLLVFKKSVKLLLVLHLASALTEQFIFKNSLTDDDRIFYGIIGIFISFIEVLLSFLIISYAFSDDSLDSPDIVTHIQKKFKDLFVETLRGLGNVMVGFILFWTLPLRIIRYFFIPYIVVFDAKYAKGEIDVLVEAKSLVQGNFLLAFTATILTQVVVWGIDITALKYNLFTAPEVWILIVILEVVIAVYIFNVFKNLYHYLKETKERI